MNGFGNESTHNRIEWIDFARGVVIILMLVGHSNPPEGVWHFIYGFHVPFFFILSGYLYNKEKWEKLGFKELLKSRLKTYIVPYFGLSLINLLINIPYEWYRGIRGGALRASTFSHLEWILYSLGQNDKVPNCTPLWFLPALFVGTVLLYFILKIENVFMQASICAVCLWPVRILASFSVRQLPWHIDIATMGMGFMLVGFYIARYKLLSKKINLFCIIVIILVASDVIFENPIIDLNNRVVNDVYLTTVGASLMSFALMLLCQKYCKKQNPISYLGQNTLIVMAFNFAINTYMSVIWKHIPLLGKYEFTWWKILIADIVFCYLLVFLWRLLAKKLPIMNTIGGTHSYNANKEG